MEKMSSKISIVDVFSLIALLVGQLIPAKWLSLLFTTIFSIYVIIRLIYSGKRKTAKEKIIKLITCTLITAITVTFITTFYKNQIKETMNFIQYDVIKNKENLLLNGTIRLQLIDTYLRLASTDVYSLNSYLGVPCGNGGLKSEKDLEEITFGTKDNMFGQKFSEFNLNSNNELLLNGVKIYKGGLMTYSSNLRKIGSYNIYTDNNDVTIKDIYGIETQLYFIFTENNSNSYETNYLEIPLFLDNKQMSGPMGFRLIDNQGEDISYSMVEISLNKDINGRKPVGGIKIETDFYGITPMVLFVPEKYLFKISLANSDRVYYKEVTLAKPNEYNIITIKCDIDR